jgi:hypothetical protein
MNIVYYNSQKEFAKANSPLALAMMKFYNEL